MKFTKETRRRAWRTCWQAAASYFVANICVIDFSQPKEIIKSALLGLVVSAGAAGIAALMNLEETEGTDE